MNGDKQYGENAWNQNITMGVGLTFRIAVLYSFTLKAHDLSNSKSLNLEEI